MSTNLLNILKAAEELLANDSAKVCLADAHTCVTRGQLDYAFQRALKSIQYSVGGFHPTYKMFAGE